MSIFEAQREKLKDSPILAPRPVGLRVGSTGFSENPAREDHSHQLETSETLIYDPVAKSNNNATNITSTGLYWIDRNRFIDVQININFSGAPTAGGVIEAQLPRTVATDAGNELILGSALLTDNGVLNYYGFKNYLNQALPSRVIWIDTVLGVWAAANPWIIGAGDYMVCWFRYRTDALL